MVKIPLLTSAYLTLDYMLRHLNNHRGSVSAIDLSVDLLQKSELRVLAQVPLLSKVVDNILSNLALEDRDVLDVLTSVELDLQDADGLIVVVSVVGFPLRNVRLSHAARRLGLHGSSRALVAVNRRESGALWPFRGSAVNGVPLSHVRGSLGRDGREASRLLHRRILTGWARLPDIAQTLAR